MQDSLTCTKIHTCTCNCHLLNVTLSVHAIMYCSSVLLVSYVTVAYVPSSKLQSFCHYSVMSCHELLVRVKTTQRGT